MQELSALQESMLYCTQAFLFASVFICELQPSLKIRGSLQSRQSMRQTLVEGRSDAANTRVVRHWYRIQASRLTSLQDTPPAHPIHVLTVWSAPVNRVQSESICGPIFSMNIGLQRLSSMQPRGLGMA